MALLKLKDIGKIYVSDGNVAVGIRGVDLSFERGEFVAITGKSGSGKSTLLNVISGMDTYEEGELYIEGQTTSHYLQPDWEEYRQKYISFIFQDYNIIESFTVLQNVELALMHIDDKKERRARALELLRRVGLSSHIKQKGSKLSGGQKQRTVIARALAKDSPIILADEPTGNLDAATSKEIIELLREVSRDKLLIVVTHNFEEVEACATRHVRIYDGAVESDHVITPPPVRHEPVMPRRPERSGRLWRKGVTLGRSIFTSKPRLSVFLCLLMIIGSLGVFSITSLSGEAAGLFTDYTMFKHIDGRVVLTKQNGAPITDAELETLRAEYGAETALHYDLLLDEGQYQSLLYKDPKNTSRQYGFGVQATYGEDYGTDIIGAYPTKDNEVFLYLPIGKQPAFGKDAIAVKTVTYCNIELQVSGIKYYYDNNQTPRLLFTDEGFRLMSAVYYMTVNSHESTVRLTVTDEQGKTLGSPDVYNDVSNVSFAVEDGKFYLFSNYYRSMQKEYPNQTLGLTLDYNTVYYNYNYDYYDAGQSMRFTASFDESKLSEKRPTLSGTYYTPDIVFSPYLLRDVAEDVFAQSYRQASLFFADDEAATLAAERLRENGYIAVPASTEYTPPASDTILVMLGALASAGMWFVTILFLAFFLNLCSSRSLSAFKGDMAIMRSMGIPVKVIRIGMYVRMLLALIPAFLTVCAAAILIFTTPKFNEMFTYLYAWQYALIFAGMLILTLRITHKQIAKLFGESVKKSLRGGKTE